MKKVLMILCSILLLTGCISPPVGLEKTEFMLQHLADIREENYMCHCKEIRVGGRIISATALDAQRTKIEVLSFPLASYSAKPILNTESDGRFIAYLNQFIDPETLKDQYITVRGQLIEKEKGKIDQVDYFYPVINVKNYKKWKLVEEYDVDIHDDWDHYWHSWHRPYFFKTQTRLRYNLY